MKKTRKTLIALLAAAALLLSLAACGATKAPDGAALMQGIYEKLLANKDYTEWKAMFGATTIEEKLDGQTITISAKGEEGINGDYSFTLEDGYIVNECPEDDYTAYSLLMDLKAAVAEYYGMNNTLLSGYLAGLRGDENKYFITENADGKTVYKLYAAGTWGLEGLDDMYVTEDAIDYCDPLGEDDSNLRVNAGKVHVACYGNKNDFAVIVGEYENNTDVSLKSLQTVVAKLQPAGYEAFAKEYTELKETQGSGFTVSFGIPEDVAQAHEFQMQDGYQYITAVFSANA